MNFPITCSAEEVIHDGEPIRIVRGKPWWLLQDAINDTEQGQKFITSGH